ncbi:hypothetical protein GT347_04870 [Xylophilus rhododendri]|uniref:OmpR/PhoB-type domain-containing protein n=1 Tax=Xylophilus rhododendri TaxID=2697032 RepID=A0A857J2C5_9BURK|nr:winged helix-turn-helix domain-containing protein [Xylophilus rhododendri]QHI97373.1 hypothetical protein GT347_04870 [Xylophilus rhododendri]
MEKKLSAVLRTGWIGMPAHELRAVAQPFTVFADGDDFLLSDDPFGLSLYVVDLVQPGVPGPDLVRLIRRKSAAGMVALSSAPHPHFVQALHDGADLAVDRAAPAEQIEALIAALRRRVQISAVIGVGGWRLHVQKGQLMAPDASTIKLSKSDVALLSAFAAAAGEVVPRSTLTEQLWGPSHDATEGALHAILYRLRKRVEQAGQPVWPMHAISGVGYEFRAPLKTV